MSIRNPEITERYATLDEPMTAEEYNFERFRPRHLLADIRRGLANHGVPAGAEAPDFALPSSDGETVRLSGLRGTPVLLHFGSYT